MADARVDIIIPVYRSLEATRRCIESVLRAPVRTAFELVIVDDASPEPDLVAYLETVATRPAVTLLRHAQNRGFVESVNRGMALHPVRDVVLLNSDTEVANDWLDRLRRAAHSEPDVATVTPFSNNATICSYPLCCAENALPRGVDIAELDRIFARENAGLTLDLPTAVGFCMYIRRDSLAQLGLFDAARFGRGYGEENDFSRRAVKAGWRNVLCADTFVYHAGSVSFGAERSERSARASTVLSALHPEYDAVVERFVADDPPAPLRQRIDMALARRRMGLNRLPAGADDGGARVVQLHVTHDLGGGVDTWVRDVCAQDRSRINLVLKPFTRGAAMAEGLLLFADAEDTHPLGFWPFTAPIGATLASHGEYREALHAILRQFRVDAVIVSSLVGHSLDVLDTGLPTVLVQHDLYPYCAALHGYFEGVCATCDDARLVECSERNPFFHPGHALYPADERLRVRQRFVDLVARRDLTLVVPSRAARLQWQRLAPNIEPARFVVIEHGMQEAFAPLVYWPGSPGEKLRVVVIGMLSVSKGVEVLREALAPMLAFCELHLVGAGALGETFRDIPGVRVIDAYERTALREVLAQIGPQVALFLSIVPETHGYTLSEAFMLGIPPVATKRGSFAERIRDGETGYLVEPDAGALVARLRAIHGDRDTLAWVRANVLAKPLRSAAEMVEDYHRLLPLRHRDDAPVPAAVPVVPRHEDPSLGLALAARTHAKAQRRLVERLALRDARIETCRHQVDELQRRLADCEATCTRLAQERAMAEQALAGREAAIAAFETSTSWRVTRPLRALARLLRGGGREIAQPERAAQPAKRTVVAAQPDWRQVAFESYRESLTDDVVRDMRLRIAAMPRPPLISVLVPTFDTPEAWLREMLDSVCAQIYPHWELCIADDGSRLPHVRAVLEAYAAADARVRISFAEANRGVSAASNRALAMARGDYAVLLDHDDMLEPQALLRVAEAIRADAPDMLYSDEVLVATDGRTVEHFAFRPAFSPEYLRGHPYIVHLVGFRTQLLRQIEGFDETLTISQDYDLILRASEAARVITHIPEALYRWRIHADSAGHQRMGEVMDASRAILKRHLERCGEAGEVMPGPAFNFFDVRYPRPAGLKVAIIIPTKNRADLVRSCIGSIERTAGDIAHDIVLVDHASDDPAALAYFDSLGGRVTVLRHEGPFNFAAINNRAVAQLDGSHSHYLFCNNDIEALAPGWLARMLELGQKPDVGIVGAKLLYPDRKTIQHAGVVVACCGIAENLGRHRLTRDDPLDLGYIGSLVCNREISAVTAACMLVTKEAFATVGGFDETIAVGYGDVDLCLRAGARGYRTLFCAHAVLVHHESASRDVAAADPHPADSERFLRRWRGMFASGDPFFNPNLAPDSPNWQVRRRLRLRSEVRFRTWHRPG